MSTDKAKSDFMDIYRQYIHRQGSEALLSWMENGSDFFSAPASTKYHLAYPGGLAEHSVNVFWALREWVPGRTCTKTSMETIAIVALLHDLCKANFYVKEYRSDGGLKGYIVKDQFPFGHGEKSCFLIRHFMDLTTEEALAIRWHMGAYDDAAKGGSRSINEAMKLYPLVYELQAADMRATHSMEQEPE